MPLITEHLYSIEIISPHFNVAMFYKNFVAIVLLNHFLFCEIVTINLPM